MSRPDQLRIDRFPVANAQFWLSMTARWLAEPGNADRFATDLWGRADTLTGAPVQVIIAEAADRLRAALSGPDADLPDADLPDADLPDAGLPDAGLPDAGLSEEPW